METTREATYPSPDTQAGKVLKVLLDADGGWVNFQYFVRTMYLTQAHSVIFNLERKFGWNIEHSDFTDEHGFKSYRIEKKPEQAKLI